MKKQNTFRPSKITYDKKSLVDCSNKSPLWKHSVERMDTKTEGNIVMSFGILFAFIVFVIYIMVAVDRKAQIDNPKPMVLMKLFNK